MSVSLFVTTWQPWTAQVGFPWLKPPKATKDFVLKEIEKATKWDINSTKKSDYCRSKVNLGINYYSCLWKERENLILSFKDFTRFPGIFIFTSRHGLLLLYFFWIVTQTLRIQEKKRPFLAWLSLWEKPCRCSALWSSAQISQRTVEPAGCQHSTVTQHIWKVCSTQVSQTPVLSALCFTQVCLAEKLPVMLWHRTGFSD